MHYSKSEEREKCEKQNSSSPVTEFSFSSRTKSVDWLAEALASERERVRVRGLDWHRVGLVTPPVLCVCDLISIG